jgi:NADH-quinone oxidoreductase subunit E
MAWISKNSATMQIERRDQAYLDEQLAAHLKKEVLVRYPTLQAATMPVLHAIQDKHGWLPDQALEEAAEFLELSPAEVRDTASFYEEYWLKPRGRYVIWLCQSISCELMGEPTLTDRITAHLGIEVGQTTEDGRITLMKVECLGACGGAPAALINQELHENITVDNFQKVLDALT